MLEKAKKGEPKNDSLSLAEQYGIPEEYKYEAQGKNGGLTIKVDARIIVPKADKMPICRVRAADFTQEQVDAFWNVLCGDAEMWEMPQQQTKEEAHQELINWIRFMREEEEEENPQALERLAQLEAAFKTAPDKVEEKRSDGKLKLIGLYADGLNQEKIASYYGLNAYEKGNGRTFLVENNNDLKEAYIEIYKDKDGNVTGWGGLSVRAMAWMCFKDDRNPAASKNFGFYNSIYVQDDTATDDKVGLTSAEAGKMVQDLLDKTNSNMIVNSMFLQDDEQKGDADGEIRSAQRYTYKVYCVRTVNDIPCALIMGESQGQADGKDNIAMDMAPTWTYERLEIMINGDGLYSLQWFAPLEIAETILEDSQLKQFSEIQEIFEKMMFIKYEAQADIAHVRYEFEIDRVTLSLQRVVEQNSISNGLLIPVWNFYGKVIETIDDTHSNIKNGESVMSINAIDGSIIDINLGY
jgi:hypothetical protein